MSAKLSSGKSRAARAAAVLVTLAMCPAAFAQEAGAVTAVFKAKEIDFSYRSTTRFYPCHKLRNVVTNVLRAIGARDDVQVRVSDCENFEMSDESEFDRWDPRQSPNDSRQFPNDPRQFPSDGFGNTRGREQLSHIRARVMTPVELTPAVLAEIDKDKSRRELVSRVTGNPAAAMNDPIVFEAKRQSVTLSRASLRLEPGDCHLLEQMMRSIFRELDVRVVRRNFTCDSRQENRITPQLTVEALLPTGALLPMPPAESERRGQKPATSATENDAPGATPETPTETAPATPPETPTQAPAEAPTENPPQ